MRTLILCLLTATSVLASPAFATPNDPKTEEEKTLYALGLAISRNLTSFNLTAAEVETVKGGLSDGILGKKAKVDLDAYGPKIGQLQQGRVAVVAEKAKKAGNAYA